MDKLTPMLSQYRAIKREHEDVILLFRLGDFYEMFGDDAKVAAEVLELVLTSREMGKGRRVPMCGIPYHAADRYIARLLAAGHKAAVCEQVEDPRRTKQLVKREVIRILTPGTVVEEHLLEERANNYLVSVVHVDGRWGLAAADSSTGEFMVTEFAGAEAPAEAGEELSRLQPSEVLVRGGDEPAAQLAAARCAGCSVTTWEADAFLAEAPAEFLKKHFGVGSLRAFGCEDLPAAVEAAAAVIAYLRRTHKSGLEQLRGLRTYTRQEFMLVDAASRRNLELLASLRDGTKQNTLLWVLDHTLTPMGARLLRQWITAPLLDRTAIERRLDGVQAFYDDAVLRGKLRDQLKEIRDLERLVARAAAATASGRDLAGLRDSLGRLPAFAETLGPALSPGGPGSHSALQALVADFDPVADLCETLRRALEEAPPANVRDGGSIRSGYSAELDELREARAHGKEWIASLQERERERTGAKSLKVGFNQVFGYYIEVTRPNVHLVPADYQRRQTMANAERFVTPELKEYEEKILGAEERILDIEQRLLANLRATVAAEAARVQRAAQVVAAADVLACLAEVAARNRYVRPAIADSDALEIRGGRHPVVELTLRDERFVPNDTHLDCAESQILIITGPNMAGKSTYLRQVALISLMAQMGSFVPADAATVGVVDRVFTRVGASDDLATGQSTFMVEMTETASILHHATGRSLIVLDEIGRGTSTFDGLSIAWSVAEHIHNAKHLGAKTLFATHYHHLNELAESLPRVKNYRIAVKEKGDQVIFLRQIVPGGTDRSYGIQVARLAGLPPEVLERAKQILWSLEQRNHVGETDMRPTLPAPHARPTSDQLALFAGAPDPIVEELRLIDVNSLTPIEALNALAELKRRAEDAGQTHTREE
ncbi:MAG: DNA mismatch repair protein MutS [Armatimonadota bacterium]|jgi:DNA mismatch repair protein MutS